MLAAHALGNFELAGQQPAVVVAAPEEGGPGFDHALMRQLALRRLQMEDDELLAVMASGVMFR